jgi:3-oxoacyl-[acyl-carrier protein] reductase
VLTGRHGASLAEAAAGIGRLSGGRVEYVVGDLADAGAAAELVRAAEDRVGGALDVLVLNAGGPPPGRIGQVDDAAWRQGLDLLLLGPLALARAVLPGMGERGFGRVVFVTSTAVRRPEPDLAVSVVARSAVTAAAKLLARDAAPGVTVNCVAPGATATDRRAEILAARASAQGASVADLERAEAAGIPAGRAADPAEIAEAIGFLASEAAAYITGTVLTVDGGRTEAIW